MGPARIGNAVTSFVVWSLALYVWKPAIVVAEAFVDLVRGVDDPPEVDLARPPRTKPASNGARPRSSEPHAPPAL
jgi:hypothetical protein